MRLFSDRLAAVALFVLALLSPGCASTEAPLAVPNEELAVELAKHDVEGFVQLLITVLHEATLDTTQLTPRLSAQLLESVIAGRQRSRELGETVTGDIRVHSQRLESVDMIGRNWHVVLLACLDYSEIVRHREDGTRLLPAVGATLPEKRVEVRIDAKSGSSEVIAVENTGASC